MLSLIAFCTVDAACIVVTGGNYFFRAVVFSLPILYVPIARRKPEPNIADLTQSIWKE